MLERLLSWVIFPALVFILCFQGGMYQRHHSNNVSSAPLKPCSPSTSSEAAPEAGASIAEVLEQPLPVVQLRADGQPPDDLLAAAAVRALPAGPAQELVEVDAEAFHKHRFEYMGEISTVSTTVLQRVGESETQDGCTKFVNPFSFIHRNGGGDKPTCLAVVKTSVPASPPIIRYKPKMVKLNDPGADGHGFFTKVTIPRSREKTALKFWPFAENFNAMERYLKNKLDSRGYAAKGIDTLVVMVVNAGELDLYMNLACSAELHGVSMDNWVVFSGSESIVDIIETTGALGLYHSSFFGVSHKASHDYLDFTFVDMMWYKCFSIYLILREGYNLVFQDVDLVWFRDPVPYFKDLIQKDSEKFTGQDVRPLDAILSDDGQRSLRYTPFFANSGFYYLASNAEMINMAYGIMTAFPMIQRLGSQQNMYTMRLLESMTNFGIRTYFLDIEDFPNGYLYHHNKPYMKRFQERMVPQAFNFHMCWTQGKKDKLKYMKLTGLWYLSEEAVEIMTRKQLKKSFKNFSALATKMCSRKEGWM